MELELERFLSDADATMGTLRVFAVSETRAESGKFSCFTLEDEHRASKLQDETRIPAGTYPVKLRTVGGMTQRYADMYPNMHAGMLWLQDVPGFEWVYIHIGNTDDDTSGCILVGDQASAVPGELRIMNSRVAYERLYQRVVGAAMGGTLTIKIIDRD